MWPINKQINNKAHRENTLRIHSSHWIYSPMYFPTHPPFLLSQSISAFCGKQNKLLGAS